MLYTGSIKDITKSVYDEVWIIVRSLGNIKTGANIYHVPQLSPSKELFNDYLSWRDQGIWNKEQFDKVYAPRFYKEMESQKQLISDLAIKSIKQDILIVCFCENENICHRSLVKKLVEAEQINHEFYLLVVGSRTFEDYDLLEERCDFFLSRHQNDRIHIVSGGARGADSLAERYAKEKGYELHVIKAEWDLYGKSAGYRRNEEMHKFISSKPMRGCIAFWDGVSKGTAHNFGLSEKYHNPMRVVRFK